MTSIEIISGPVVEVALQGDINIFVAARLKQELSKALELTNDIRISLAGASTLDITAIQLLWAAARHARMQGRAFTFETPCRRKFWPACMWRESHAALCWRANETRAGGHGTGGRR